MVQNIGFNILVPIGAFAFLIGGALIMANAALKDVVARRKKH